MSKKKDHHVEYVNRRAAHDFHFVQKYEAGIQLYGTEVKSIRAGHVSLTDAYCHFRGGELYIVSLYIKPYEYGGTYYNHDDRRIRKLLLKRQELRKLEKRVKEKGFSIIPYKLYLNERGYVKLEIALATGKKSFDKRETLKSKDVKRDLDRIKKEFKNRD